MAPASAALNASPTERSCPCSPPDALREIRQGETPPTVTAFDGSSHA